MYSPKIENIIAIFKTYDVIEDEPVENGHYCLNLGNLKKNFEAIRSEYLGLPQKSFWQRLVAFFFG